MEKEVILKTAGLVGFIEAFREVAKKTGIQKGGTVFFRVVLEVVFQQSLTSLSLSKTSVQLCIGFQMQI